MKNLLYNIKALPFILLTSVGFWILPDFSRAQDTVVIGQGAIKTNYEIPFYNQRARGTTQYLLKSNEFKSAGVHYPISINAIGLRFSRLDDNTPGPSIDLFLGMRDSTFDFIEVPVPNHQSKGILEKIHHQALSTSGDIPQDGLNFLHFTHPLSFDPNKNMLVKYCAFEDTANGGANIIKGDSYSDLTDFYSIQVQRNSWDNLYRDPCDDLLSDGIGKYRPQFYFLYDSLKTAPKAEIEVSRTHSCDPGFSFADNSYFAPSSWRWDFGDGSVDSIPFPYHQYSNPGTYSVRLIVGNQYGFDTTYQAVVYDTSQLTTPALGCYMVGPDLDPTYGIQRFNMAGVTYMGNIASIWQDKTCSFVVGEAGTIIPFDVELAGSLAHRISVWIDLDGDGTFGVDERLYSQEATKRAFGQIFIPGSVVENSSLRLRVKADQVTANGSGDPCRYPLKGNVKDFGFFALPSTQIPEAAVADYSVKVCDGVLRLQDRSLHVPNSWLWDFGNGDTSHLQQPTYTYTTPGIYQVTLITSNQFGSDTLLLPDSIEVKTNLGMSLPQCIPYSDNACCGYGVFRFSISQGTALPGQKGIDVVNEDWQDLDYQDFSCTHIAEVFEGDQIGFSWMNQQGIDQAIGVWVDWNNDGIFTADEKELTTNNAILGGSFGGTTWVPRDATMNVPLRVRVIADPNTKNLNDPCKSPEFGQAEDYGLIVRPSGPILDPSELPWCEIGIHNNNPCDDNHLFQAKLSSNATSFEWDFGDGTTSPAMRPSHSFSTGQHLVQLKAQNSVGTFIDSFSFSVGPCEELHFPIYDSNRVHSECHYEVIKYPHFSWPGSSSTDMYLHKFEHPNPNMRYQVNFDRVDLSAEGKAVPAFAEFVVVDGLLKTDPELARVSYNADTSIIVRSSSNKMAIFCDNKLNTFDLRFPFLDLSVQVSCIDVVSTNEVEAESSIVIWPNPADKKVNLSKSCKWELRNTAGQLVIKGKGNLVDVTAIPPGIYLIGFELKNTNSSQRLIIY